jgi:hypothetical protein
LLAIAQILLSGSYHFIDETDAIKFFRQFVELSITEESVETKDSALTIASLLLNRVRQHLGKETESISIMLNDAKRALSSARQAAVLSAMQNKVQAAKTRLEAPKSRTFKFPDLDIARAAQNVMEDAAGDWYQDPWGWPEVNWLGRIRPNIVMERLSEDACGWSVPLDVSKRYGGVRPAIVINPLDRVAFQALVDDISIEAAADLPSWVHGWRLARSHPRKGRYESNHAEWNRFSGRVTTLCKFYKFTAHLDIRSFFATVDTSCLLSQLSRRYRKAPVIDRLESYFYAWQRRQNGTGIPQRFSASSVLAHATLRPLDAFISSLGSSFASSRWMDDIWIHSDNERALRTCVKEIEDVLAETRLSLNAEKTEIFSSDQAEKVAHLVDVYEDAEDDNPTLSLEDLAAEPPFQISKKVAKLLKNKNFTSLNEIPEDRWMEFSYISKVLAKGFRVSGDWKRFVDTYIVFVHTHVSEGNLSVASWGEMFPNKADEAVRKIRDLFFENIVEGDRRLLTPLAAQRLVAWSDHFGPSGLTDFNFDQTDGSADMFSLRGVSFATLQLRGLKEKTAKAALDPVTASFLKDTSFEAPPLSARFTSE